MRLLIDFFPIVLFFLAYQWQGIYVATAVLMGATLAQTALIYAIDRRLQTLHKVTLLLVLAFGALTLILHDDRFIKWKPTVLYGAMALALAAAQGLWKKNVLQLLLGTQLRLPHSVWTRLTLAWVGYCLFMAALNAYVAAFFSTDAWVDFKLWGYIFPVLFLIGQGVYVARHLKDDMT
ncbi:septation protein A [Tepidimonas charontis]|uniref:Inner membrane-spanning protein YciB n=1 Tax=Tepidimonas charontis TaxID=2267262 RepID=A0A554XEH5_9BURK|nr:septation protein A [Tepidimonas charontis]TSE34233.1 putative intracellular septation protein A [Tepidimonas charontis]